MCRPESEEACTYGAQSALAVAAPGGDTAHEVFGYAGGEIYGLV